MGFPVVAAISAGAGLLGQALQGRGQRKADERYNEGMMQRQLQAQRHNVEFWHMQNQYNTPQAQMERLRAAGLNPALMYGKGASAGNAGQIAPAKAAPMQSNNPLAHLGTFADWRVKNAQADNMKAQNEVIAQDALLKMAQAQSHLAGAAKSKEEVRQLKKTFQYTLDGLKVGIEQQRKNLEGTGLQNELFRETMDMKKAKLAQEIENLEQAKATAKSQEQLNRINIKIKRKEAEINNLYVKGISIGKEIFREIDSIGRELLK